MIDVITKCDSSVWYKVRRVCVTMCDRYLWLRLLQSATGVIKCDDCYKVLQYTRVCFSPRRLAYRPIQTQELTNPSKNIKWSPMYEYCKAGHGTAPRITQVTSLEHRPIRCVVGGQPTIGRWYMTRETFAWEWTANETSHRSNLWSRSLARRMRCVG